jgi:peptidyl-tRNA hydrolase, PTH1 family
MKLIVGLGNVGPRYAHTRHNIGFMVADQLAGGLDAAWKLEPKFKAELAETELAGERVILAKPQTMMNLSGEAVQKLMQFYKLAPDQVWVIFDDVDVPFGRLRLRQGGSSGQQGVRSITQHIGPDFIRARMGISLNDRAVEPSEVYVLKPFNTDEQAQLPTIIKQAGVRLQEILTQREPIEATFELTSSN